MGNCIGRPQTLGCFSVNRGQDDSVESVFPNQAEKPMTQAEFSAALDQWCNEAVADALDEYKDAASKMLDCFIAGRDTPQNIVATQLDLSQHGSLRSLPAVLCELAELHILNLWSCKALRNLPQDIGNLLSLQKLALGHCENLENLPESICNLHALQTLNLSNCGRLKNLPEHIGDLHSLQELALSSCDKLKNLPNSIGNLLALQVLRVGGMALEALPDSIGNLPALQELSIFYCNNLETLPDSIGNLHSLRELRLRGCDKLENLPESTANLPGLQTLEFIGSKHINNFLENIGNLKALQNLLFLYCHKLENLPESICNLKALKNLNLLGCVALKSLPNSIRYLPSLTHLGLAGCTALENMSKSIGHLRHLTRLNLQQLGLTQVPNVLLEFPPNSEILLRGNPLPDEEILRVRSLLAQRREQRQPVPTLVLPLLQNEVINVEDALRMAAEGGMNVHVPEFTATVRARIVELAAQFPDHLCGRPNAQKQEMRTIKERLEHMLEQDGAGHLDDEGSPDLPQALDSMNRMFAVGLGEQAAYVNDFDYSAGHVLSYVVLAIERQWQQTPLEFLEEAKQNGIDQLITALAAAKGYCDTRLVEEVFQIVDMALSQYAEQHPEIIGAKPVSLSIEEVRDSTLPVAKRVLQELLQGPSPSNLIEAQLQAAFRRALTAEMRRDHPAIKAEHLTDYIDTHIIAAWDLFKEQVLEGAAAYS